MANSEEDDNKVQTTPNGDTNATSIMTTAQQNNAIPASADTSAANTSTASSMPPLFIPDSNLTENANANPNMAANAQLATAPVTPTTNANNGGAGIDPLLAAGAIAAPVGPWGNIGKQQQEAALAGQQQQFAQGQAAQKGGQENVGFQQNQAVQQALNDPNSPINVGALGYLKSIGINMPPGVTMNQLEKVAPGITEKVLSTSGMQTFNNKMAEESANYAKDIPGYEQAYGATGDALNNAKDIVGSLQKDNKWNPALLQTAFTAAQSDDATAKFLSAGYDKRYIDLVHSAQAAGSTFSKMSGSGTDSSTKLIMNALVNPVDPVKSLTAFQKTVDNTRKNAKAGYEHGQQTGQRYSGSYTPPEPENPYPENDTSTKAGSSTTSTTNSIKKTLLVYDAKGNPVGKINNTPTQINLAKKQNYTIEDN